MKPPEKPGLPDQMGPTSSPRLSVEEILRFVESFPALLWRIDIVKNRIEFLNRHQIGGLGDNSGLILQDMRFARRVVGKDDLPLLENFMAAVRNAHSASSVFRIQTQGRTRWIKLMGAVYARDPRFYIGAMLDCSDTVDTIFGLRVQENSNHGREAGNAPLRSAAKGPAGRRSAHGRMKNDAAGLLKKIEGKDRMGDILGLLLSDQPPRTNAEAIIYSDVYARKNRVNVYTAGTVLAALPQGQVFPYEGTIAENIERYQLDHLIVDDTFASIKAIDWALFIPRGIRSYFAKPFYDRSVLRSVLILCSTRPGAFSDQKLAVYSCLYQAFLAGLKTWRKAARKKKPA